MVMLMDASKPTTARALHLTLTACLALASSAFHSPAAAVARHRHRHHRPTTASTATTPRSAIAAAAGGTTTALHASRKGNRGARNKRAVSDRTAGRARPAINDVLEGITSPPEFPHSVDPADVPPGPAEDDPLAPLVRTIVRAADSRKASDVVAMRVSGCTSMTSFVVIASGTSRPQNRAIAAAVAKDVEEEHEGKRCLGSGVPEGTAESGWMLLDYGEVMVHIMTPKSRLFYDMDGQWKNRGGEPMDLSDVLVDEMVGSVEDKLPGKVEGELSMKDRMDVEKEFDPFWS